MFNVDRDQRRIIRHAVGSAFVFSMFSQIADTSFFERLWHQAAIITLGVGAVRVCMRSERIDVSIMSGPGRS